MKIEEYISKQAKASEGAFSPSTRDSTVAIVIRGVKRQNRLEEEELYQEREPWARHPQGAA